MLLPRAADAAAKLAKSGFTRVCFLGSGALMATAAESALKVQELTAGRVFTMSQSFLGLRHGPLSFLDRQTLVVAYLASDELTRLYETDLLRELSDKKLGATTAVTGFALPREIGQLADVALELGPATGAQSAAGRAAATAGRDLRSVAGTVLLARTGAEAGYAEPLGSDLAGGLTRQNPPHGCHLCTLFRRSSDSLEVPPSGSALSALRCPLTFLLLAAFAWPRMAGANSMVQHPASAGDVLACLDFANSTEGRIGNLVIEARWPLKDGKPAAWRYGSARWAGVAVERPVPNRPGRWTRVGTGRDDAAGAGTPGAASP